MFRFFKQQLRIIGCHHKNICFMKKGLFTVLCFAMFFSCRKHHIDNHVPYYNDLTGTWGMASYKNNITGVVSTKPANIANRPDPILILSVRDSNYVELEGYTYSNEIGGQFSMSYNNAISNISFGGTQVGEPEWYLKWMMQLTKTNRYYFIDINHLCLVTSSDTTMNFYRK
jgi:hypothetical protein